MQHFSEELCAFVQKVMTLKSHKIKDSSQMDKFATNVMHVRINWRLYDLTFKAPVPLIREHSTRREPPSARSMTQHLHRL